MASPGYLLITVDQPQVVVSEQLRRQLPTPSMQTASADPYQPIPQQVIQPAPYSPRERAECADVSERAND